MPGIATKLDHAAKSTARLLVGFLVLVLSYIGIWIVIGALFGSAELLMAKPLLGKLLAIPLLVAAVFSNQVVTNMVDLLLESTGKGGLDDPFPSCAILHQDTD
jgi:hypothetical protein